MKKRFFLLSLLVLIYCSSEAQDWSTSGNSLTTTSFLGSNVSSNTNPIIFKTGNGSTTVERMRISGGTSGFVGIEAPVPISKLHVNGDIAFGSISNGRRWRMSTQSNISQGKYFLLPDDASGNPDFTSAFVINPLTKTMLFGHEGGNLNVAIGSSTTLLNKGLSSSQLSSSRGYIGFNLQRTSLLTSNWVSNSNSGAGMIWSNVAGSLLFAPIYGTPHSVAGYYFDQDIVDRKTLEIRWNPNMSSTHKGQVIIGGETIYNGNHTDFRLSVDGKLLTKEIYVTNAGWADYVFDENYTLKPLDEVDKFIKANKHLPNIPSAKEISEQGNNMANTDRLLLEKIEELTLYMIELKKRIVELESKTSN
jgi:hypothetical protein